MLRIIQSMLVQGEYLGPKTFLELVILEERLLQKYSFDKDATGLPDLTHAQGTLQELFWHTELLKSFREEEFKQDKKLYDKIWKQYHDHNRKKNEKAF